jgi:site-specific recombinase XerD
MTKSLLAAAEILDLPALLESWRLAMTAERKAAGTIRTYTAGVTAYLRWCDATRTPADLTKQSVERFIVSLHDAGLEPATARTRHVGCKQFATWLADEGEIPSNPLATSKQPKVDKKVIKALSDDELHRLVKACSGKRPFMDRRDEALVRFMAETMLRASEVIGLKVADIDMTQGRATVMGKGGKGRIVPFGPQTAAALDRYLRARRTHRFADTGKLWLGGDGKTFGYHGLDEALKARAQKAGITGFTCHVLRRTGSTRWLALGGSENGLMAVAGWSSRTMLDHYTGASASLRAHDEARTLGLGDL